MPISVYYEYTIVLLCKNANDDVANLREQLCETISSKNSEIGTGGLLEILPEPLSTYFFFSYDVPNFNH